MRAGIALAPLVLAALTLLPAAAAVNVTSIGHTPDPPSPGEMATISATVDDPAPLNSVKLITCTLDPYICNLPKDMAAGSATYTATTPPYPAGTEVGYNLTLYYTNGSRGKSPHLDVALPPNFSLAGLYYYVRWRDPSARAPAFLLTAVDGSTVNLTAWRDDALVLTFLDLDTPDAAETVARIKEVQAAGGGTHYLTVVANASRTPADIQAFAQANAISWPVALTDHRASLQYGVMSNPRVAVLLGGDLSVRFLEIGTPPASARTFVISRDGYIVYTYTGVPAAADLQQKIGWAKQSVGETPSEVPWLWIFAGVSLAAGVATFVLLRTRRAGLAKLGLMAGVLVAAALILLPVFAPAAAPKPAADFTLVDITDANRTAYQLSALTKTQGKTVLVDFMSLNCGSCRITEANLKELVPDYQDRVVFLSVAVDPTDAEADLVAFDQRNNIPWPIGRDGDGSIITAYAVDKISRVVVVDKGGFATFDYTGVVVTDPGAQRQLIQSALDAAIAGTATPVTIQEVSIPVLAILAAVGSFFSPCSFPLLPGYVGLYLRLTTQEGKKTWGRAMWNGTATAAGIITVYGLLGLGIVAVGSAAKAAVPLLGPIVGVLLIVFGALLFTNYQWTFLIKAFEGVRRRLTGAANPAAGGATTRLYGFGIGYGAAASGCVAPLFIAAVVNASVSGGVGSGLLVLGLYAGVTLALMLAITAAIFAAGQSAVQWITKYTDLIKKVSAVILIAVGAYLIYFYYTAFLRA